MFAASRLPHSIGERAQAFGSPSASLTRVDEVTLRKMRFSRTLQLIAAIGFAIATITRAITTGMELWTFVFALCTVLASATWYVTNRTIRRGSRELHG